MVQGASSSTEHGAQEAGGRPWCADHATTSVYMRMACGELVPYAAVVQRHDAPERSSAFLAATSSHRPEAQAGGTTLLEQWQALRDAQKRGNTEEVRRIEEKAPVLARILNDAHNPCWRVLRSYENVPAPNPEARSEIQRELQKIEEAKARERARAEAEARAKAKAEAEARAAKERAEAEARAKAEEKAAKERAEAEARAKEEAEAKAAQAKAEAEARAAKERAEARAAKARAEAARAREKKEAPRSSAPEPAKDSSTDNSRLLAAVLNNCIMKEAKQERLWDLLAIEDKALHAPVKPGTNDALKKLSINVSHMQCTSKSCLVLAPELMRQAESLGREFGGSCRHRAARMIVRHVLHNTMREQTCMEELFTGASMLVSLSARSRLFEAQLCLELYDTNPLTVPCVPRAGVPECDALFRRILDEHRAGHAQSFEVLFAMMQVRVPHGRTNPFSMHGGCAWIEQALGVAERALRELPPAAPALLLLADMLESFWAMATLALGASRAKVDELMARTEAFVAKVQAARGGGRPAPAHFRRELPLPEYNDLLL